MGIRLRLKLQNVVEFGPVNDARVVQLALSHFGPAPLEMPIKPIDAQELADMVFEELQSICGRDLDIDDIDAVGWLNSISSMAGLVLTLGRINNDDGWVLTVG
jgi:hypothetical protein